MKALAEKVEAPTRMRARARTAARPRPGRGMNNFLRLTGEAPSADDVDGRDAGGWAEHMHRLTAGESCNLAARCSLRAALDRRRSPSRSRLRAASAAAEIAGRNDASVLSVIFVQRLPGTSTLYCVK